MKKIIAIIIVAAVVVSLGMTINGNEGIAPCAVSALNLVSDDRIITKDGMVLDDDIDEDFTYGGDESMTSYINVGSSAQGMCTLDADTGEVIFQKNMNKQLEMASTTKICTAITVLENYTSLARPVPVPKQAAGIEGSSVYLRAGELLSPLDLLYGLMLRSGNDCAVALAYIVSGSVEGFARLMNETAQKAGAQNSNFVNPHGLSCDGHYTTAYDLALITKYAMANPVFREIVASKRHDIPDQEYGKRVMYNKNKILSMFDGGNGVKTGFTKRAGRCLVSSATRENHTVICVVLSCGPMFEECCTLMDRAFKELCA